VDAKEILKKQNLKGSKQMQTLNHNLAEGKTAAPAKELQSEFDQ